MPTNLKLQPHALAGASPESKVSATMAVTNPAGGHLIRARFHLVEMCPNGSNTSVKAAYHPFYTKTLSKFATALPERSAVSLDAGGFQLQVFNNILVQHPTLDKHATILFSVGDLDNIFVRQISTDLQQLWESSTYKSNPPRRDLCQIAILGSQFFKQQNLNAMPSTTGKAVKK